jgi:cation transport ATPase
MRKQTESLILLVILGLFTLGMLTSGGSQKTNECIVTLRLDNLSNDQVNEKINKALQLVKGVKSYVFNYRTRTCTLRYLDNQIDLSTIIKIFEKYGIKITPITENDLRVIPPDTSRTAFSVKVTSASEISY